MERVESFLKRIENYMRENNINYGRFAYSVESLPEAFKREIKAIFQKTTDEFVGPAKTWINFSFDEDDNLYMFIGNRCNRGKIVVYQDGHYPDVYAERISESKFVEEACQEETAKLRLEVEKKPILAKYLSKYLEDVNIRESVVEEIGEMTENICAYLSYLQKCEREDVIEISYVDPEASPTDRTIKVHGGDIKPRIHEILASDERVTILEQFNPKYRFRAQNQEGTRIYNVRVFGVPDGSHRIIMDPEEGKGHIKVSYLGNQGELSEGECSRRCIDLLQMTRDEITADPTMTRHQHRNIEDYEQLVSYIVTGEGKVNYMARKAIDNAAEAAVLIKK